MLRFMVRVKGRGSFSGKGTVRCRDMVVVRACVK
jgi:hypothetical protein